MPRKRRPPVRKPRIVTANVRSNPQARRFLRLYATGRSEIKEIAESIGVSREQCHRWLRHPDAQELLREIYAELDTITMHAHVQNQFEQVAARNRKRRGNG